MIEEIQTQIQDLEALATKDSQVRQEVNALHQEAQRLFQESDTLTPELINLIIPK